MKNYFILYLLTLCMVFNSCEKDDPNSDSNSSSNSDSNVIGCTDENATNYDADATEPCSDCCYYSEGGVWNYDSWTLNGAQFGSDYSSYLFICESGNWWGTEIYDEYNDLTTLSAWGTYTINNDKTEGTFTQTMAYNPSTGQFENTTLPYTLEVTINKLDDNELDLTITYDGYTEVITSVKSPLNVPECN